MLPSRDEDGEDAELACTPLAQAQTHRAEAESTQTPTARKGERIQRQPSRNSVCTIADVYPLVNHRFARSCERLPAPLWKTFRFATGGNARGPGPRRLRRPP